MAQMRLIKHERTPQSASYEVRFADGRPSQYFCWDDLPSRRLDPNTLTGEQALEQAKAALKPQLASLGIVNTVVPVQDARIFIELINAPMLYEHKATPAEYKAGVDYATAKGVVGAARRRYVCTLHPGRRRPVCVMVRQPR
jgi:hypothetical protein